MKMFNPQVQQQQQQQQGGGLLGTLFNLLGTLAPAIGGPAGTIASVGKAVTNPNAQNLSGVIGEMASIVGDNNNDGKPDSATQGNQTPFMGPVEEKQNPGFVGPQQETALENPGTSQVNDQNQAPIGEDTQKQPEAETDVYGNMTVRDMFNQYPGLESMFPTLLGQLQRNQLG